MDTERTAGTEFPAVNRPDPDQRSKAGQDAASEEPTLPVAAVARRLGVAPATLRTWDRRYGLGPGGHTNGKHRRYGPIDIARLEVMQRALLSGAATAEAAQYALDSVKPDDPAPLDLTGAVPSQPTSRDAPFVDDARSALGPSRLARRLSAAALAMDARMVQQLLAEAIAADGPVAAWERVISPVLSAVGAGWRGSRSGPEAEFLLTEFTFGALVRATSVVERPRNHHPVMLACPSPERSSLALYALAAALAERQIDALVFGTSLPADVLVATARRTVPAAIVLWTQRPASANPALFTRLARGKQRSRLFACGPGWGSGDLPGTVELLGGMSSAVDRISYVLLGRR